MNILERYIFRRAFVMFAASFGVTLAIVWTTQVLARVNLVTDSGQSVGSFLMLATLILPTTVPEVVPFALLIAAVQTLTTMNNDSELVVISAAGSTRLTTFRPIMALALIAGLLSFSIQNFVDPIARHKLREGVAAARADLLSSVVQEGVFRSIGEGLYVQVGDRLAGGRLGSVFIVDLRQKGTEFIYYAKEAIVTGAVGRSILLMNNGQVHRKIGGDEVSVIRYDTYAFDLGLFAPSTGSFELAPEARSLGYLFNPDPQDGFYKFDPLGFRHLLHKRLTDWLYPIAFGFLALAVAADARSHRQSRIHPLLTAMWLALFVRWAGFFAGGEARASEVYIIGMYLAPIAAGVVSFMLLATHRTLELPVFIVDRAIGASQWVTDRIRGAVFRFRTRAFPPGRPV